MSHHGRIDCVDVANLLQPFVDHEVSDAEREPVLEHLHECTVCAAVVREQQEVQASLRFLGVTSAPARLKTNILQALDRIDLEGSDHAASQSSSAHLVASNLSDPLVQSSRESEMQEKPRSVAPHLSNVVVSPISRSRTNASGGWLQKVRKVSVFATSALAAGIALVTLNQQVQSGSSAPALLSAVQESGASIDGRAISQPPNLANGANAPSENTTPAPSELALAQAMTTSDIDSHALMSSESLDNEPFIAQQGDSKRQDKEAPTTKRSDRGKSPKKNVAPRTRLNDGDRHDDESPLPSEPRRSNRRTMSGGVLQWASTNHLPRDIAFESAGPNVITYRELNLGIQVVDRQTPAESAEAVGRLFSTPHGPFYLSRDRFGRARVQFIVDDVQHELTLPDQQPAAFDLPIDVDSSDFRPLVQLGGAIRRSAF
jgi:hypothetical protein